MTLDAGGTNFVFSALCGGKEIVSPVTLPSHADDLQKSLKAIIKGFQQVFDALDENPAAISFAFPGPADYPNGIINNVGNLPAYARGVALGPMLEDQFEIPVFINNDGDLFAYGEAMGGLLPEINQKLQKKNIPKQYKNLLGVTIGTGFGGGIVVNGQLSSGDNSASAEIWMSRNFGDAGMIAEEGVSIRAIQKTYREQDPETDEKLSPKDIYDIAKGRKSGNQKAAVQAFETMGTILGESLANAITMIDGIVVIGGGISGAHDLFLPSAVKQLSGTIGGADGKSFSRLISRVFNLENEDSAKEFYSASAKEIDVPFSDEKVKYLPEKSLAVGVSRLGTSNATALGAYAFALNQLDKN